MWALDVSEYDLDELEETSTVDTYAIPDTIEDNP
jgi:hypothetical protein